MTIGKCLAVCVDQLGHLEVSILTSGGQDIGFGLLAQDESSASGSTM